MLAEKGDRQTDGRGEGEGEREVEGEGEEREKEKERENEPHFFFPPVADLFWYHL